MSATRNRCTAFAPAAPAHDVASAPVLAQSATHPGRNGNSAAPTQSGGSSPSRGGAGNKEDAHAPSVPPSSVSADERGPIELNRTKSPKALSQSGVPGAADATCSFEISVDGTGDKAALPAPGVLREQNT